MQDFGEGEFIRCNPEGVVHVCHNGVMNVFGWTRGYCGSIAFKFLLDCSDEGVIVDFL